MSIVTQSGFVLSKSKTYKSDLIVNFIVSSGESVQLLLKERLARKIFNVVVESNKLEFTYDTRYSIPILTDATVLHTYYNDFLENSALDLLFLALEVTSTFCKPGLSNEVLYCIFSEFMALKKEHLKGCIYFFLSLMLVEGFIDDYEITKLNIFSKFSLHMSIDLLNYSTSFSMDPRIMLKSIVERLEHILSQKINSKMYL